MLMHHLWHLFGNVTKKVCQATASNWLLLSSAAIYLCKRTMQNKARLELADYEAVSALFTLLELSSVPYLYTTDLLNKAIIYTTTASLRSHAPEL